MLAQALLIAVLAFQDSVAALFEALDVARGPAQEELVQRLERLGAPAAALTLAPSSSPFAELPLEARRARAALLAAIGTASEIPAALAALDDQDGRVRVDLVRFLARPVLRDVQVDERVARLAQCVQAVEAPDVRDASIEGLARIDHAAAARALEVACRRASGLEQVELARALAGHAKARDVITELCIRALASDGAELSGAALAELLSVGFGRALAESPGGGAAPADRAVFARGIRSADQRVQRATRDALDRFVARCRGLGESERAEGMLSALCGTGFDDDRLAELSIELALERAGGAERALERALEIVRTNPLNDAVSARHARARGALYAVAALIALGRGSEGETYLRDAEVTLGAVQGERSELRRVAERDAVDALEFDDRLMSALVPLYRMWIALLAGAAPDSRAVLTLARDVDRELLAAQLWVARSVYGVHPSIDELYQHALGPATLWFARSKVHQGADERRLEIELAMGRAFATVTNGGVPGFEPYEQSEAKLRDPLTDRERRHLLEMIQKTEHRTALDQLDREIRDMQRGGGLVDLVAREELQQRRFYLARRFEEEESTGGDEALRTLRGVSRAGLALSERQREHGRAETARRTAERTLADLERLRGAMSDVAHSRTVAATESALGGALMDLERPADAEVVLLRALERLRGAQRESEQREDEASLRGIRAQIAGMFTSLAVNANVKAREPEKALEYFEQAYELDQSDFMRVLLACYRARAGRADEARAALAEVPVSPNNYYNLACTYALLGERELALDFLRRDFAELRTSRGARARQAEWAGKDPDLASLIDDPRFQSLVRVDPADVEDR